MDWYCDNCKKIHKSEELCPRIGEQLKNHPEWIGEVADFTVVAGQETLITSQALDDVAQGINKLIGTELSYEGTKQFTRDIQVFNRLDIERFPIKGYFNTPESAKQFMENATNNQLKNLRTNLNGMGQEIDWLREQQGSIRNLVQKSELGMNNMPGVDGITYNRFTGKEISRTTVKAFGTKGGMNTNVQSIMKALKSGRLAPEDIIYAPDGMKDAVLDKLDKEINNAISNNDQNTVEILQKAKENLKFTEKGSIDSVNKSSDRLTEKIKNGQAITKPTLEQVGKKIGQGAIIGAAVSLTVSSITSYVRYKNGEIDIKEAFSNVSEETIKGALVGGALAGITIFLPGGAIGFVAGVGIGIYVSSVCGNVLDEIYGKGGFGAILDSSGYVYGMTFNLAEYYERIKKNNEATKNNINQANAIQSEIDSNFDIFEKMKRGN